MDLLGHCFCSLLNEALHVEAQNKLKLLAWVIWKRFVIILPSLPYHSFAQVQGCSALLLFQIVDLLECLEVEREATNSGEFT